MSLRSKIAEIIGEETSAAGARATTRIEALLVGDGEAAHEAGPADKARHAVGDVREAIVSALKEAGGPLGFSEIRVRAAARASDITVRKALGELRKSGSVVMEGERSTATYRLA